MANKKDSTKKTTTTKKTTVKKTAPKTVKEEVKKEKVITPETSEEVMEETNEDKGISKNTILIIGVIIVLLIAIIVSSNNNDNSSESKSLSLTEITCDNETDNIEQDADSKLNKVSCNGYEQLVKEEKDNLILIARPTCGYCVKFVPVLEEIIDEYDITINYFDIDTLTDNENKQFYNSSSLFSGNEFGTPTLIITNNNEIKKYSIGYKEKDSAISWLKENGIITE